jgi:hypothetical protein
VNERRRVLFWLAVLVLAIVANLITWPIVVAWLRS